MAPRTRKAKPDDQIRLSDPQAIKALTHPARMAVLDALGADRTLTATEAAQLAGLSPSAMSYHLRAMAKWGVLIEAEPAGDGRERRWKLAGTGFTIEGNNPAAAAPTAIIAANALDRTRRAAVDWIGGGGLDQPAEWQRIMAVSHTEIWLTDEEASAIADEVNALFERHRDRRRANKPEDARRVRLGFVLVPID